MSDGGGCFDGHLGDEPGGRRVLPAGFADLPAGLGLAAAVAGVDVAGCNGFELEESIKARRRLICWLEAECLSDVNALAYAEPGMVDGPAGRRVTPDPMTPEVLEPLLGWTGYRAHQYVALAATLPRLPRVREALASGQLELNDVRVIVDRITDAEPDVWGAIEEAIFPKVLELRGGLLRAKVEAEVVTADPDAAAKRHRAARSGRNVAIWPAVDGVADLAIRGLSAGQAAEAYGHIDAIARAVKSTGDPRTLSQLRADVAAALLTGTADIKDCSAPAATHHTKQEEAQSQAQHQPAQDQAERAEGESEQTPDEQGHCPIHCYPDHDLHSAGCDCGDCAPAGTANTTAHYTPCHCSTTHDSAAHDAAERSAAAEDADSSAIGQNAAGRGAATGGAAAPDGGRPTAGQIPRQNRRPDETADPPDPPDPPTGNPTPPTPPWCSSQPSWGAIRTRAKIQLNVPLTTLMGLSSQPGELGGFGPVITEVARRVVANNLGNPEARFSVGVTHPVTGRLLHLHPIPARFLRGLQAELVHARDQRCAWTTCRRPAATCHLDHNTEHHHGGQTAVDNIAPLCPRHHKTKTERDWKLEQTGPGEHILTDPHGRQYHSRTPSLTDPVVPPERAVTTTGTRTVDNDLPPF
ncbi:HNH endonuclease signature motif containing protein [Actinopolymorpha singaporensis]|uniref:HNH endonuclease signature motif containing protein n=1 Tax=Actinopolymorpha singaporensis TaxID=117157 RepID=UPI0018D33ED4|nr:HNH endonuclease signature motif containing protein [Actinopolymorpha singaporensis]